MEGKRSPAASEPTFVLEESDLEPPGSPAPRSGLGVWRSFLFGAAKSAKSPDKPRPARKPAPKAKAVEPERPKRNSEPPKKRVKPILDSRGTIRAGAPVPIKRVKVAKRRGSDPPPPPRPQQDSAEEVRMEELWVVERTVTLTGADMPTAVRKAPVIDDQAIDSSELGGMVAELRMASKVPPPPIVPRDLPIPPPPPPVVLEPTPVPAPAAAPALDSTHRLSWSSPEMSSNFPVAMPPVTETIPPGPPARPRKRSPLMSVALVMFVFAFVGVAAVYGRPMLRSMATASVAAPVQAAPALPEAEEPATLSVVNRDTPGAAPMAISIMTATTITTSTSTATPTATEKARPTPPKRSTAIALQHAAPPPPSPPRPRATAAPAPAKPAQTAQETDEAKQDLGRAKDVIDTTLQ